MAVTKAQLDGNRRYLEKLDDMKIRVPKGHRDVYKAFAAEQGKSLNALVVDLLNTAMLTSGVTPPSAPARTPAEDSPDA